MKITRNTLIKNVEKIISEQRKRKVSIEMVATVEHEGISMKMTLLKDVHSPVVVVVAASPLLAFEWIFPLQLSNFFLLRLL